MTDTHPGTSSEQRGLPWSGPPSPLPGPSGIPWRGHSTPRPLPPHYCQPSVDSWPVPGAQLGCLVPACPSSHEKQGYSTAFPDSEAQTVSNASVVT